MAPRRAIGAACLLGPSYTGNRIYATAGKVEHPNATSAFTFNTTGKYLNQSAKILLAAATNLNMCLAFPD
jgi:hypothetical protein